MPLNIKDDRSVLVVAGVGVIAVIYVLKRLNRKPKNFLFKHKEDEKGEANLNNVKRQQIPTAPSIDVWKIALNSLIPFIPAPPLHLLAQKWEKKYGDFVQFSFGGKPVILLRDPNIAQQIKNFPKPQGSQTSYQEFTPYGLLAMQEDGSGNSLWKQHRRFMQPYFALSFVNRMGSEMYLQSNILVDLLTAKLNSTNEIVVDIHSSLTNLTLDIICKTALGYELHSMHQSDSKLLNSFKIAWDWISHIQTTPVRLSKFMKTPGYSQFLKARDTISNLFDQIIEDTRERMDKHQISSDQSPNFLEALLAPPESLNNNDEVDDNNEFSLHDENINSTESLSAVWSNQELKDEVLTLIAAGHETTNNTLSFFFHNLAVNPEIQAKIHAEIDSIIKSKGDLNEFSFSESSFSKFKYLSQSLKESMRFTPAVPLTSRLVPESCALQTSTDRSIYLEKGTTVIIDIGGLNKHPDYWESPEKFNPDHFDEDQMIKRKSKYANIPFGVGMKSCLGYRFAMLEAKIIALTLLYHFEFRSTSPFLKQDWKITAKPVDGCNLYVKLRS